MVIDQNGVEEEGWYTSMRSLYPFTIHAPSSVISTDSSHAAIGHITSQSGVLLLSYSEILWSFRPQPVTVFRLTLETLATLEMEAASTAIQFTPGAMGASDDAGT